jgi:hypothetical protein
MLRISKHITIVFLCTLILASYSCKNDKNSTPLFGSNESSVSDTLSLRIALLPIKECDVLRHAQESGLATRMGLDMELISYDAMMDIDTAVLSNIAHIYFEDSLRICRIHADSIRPSMLLPIPVEMKLIVNNDKEIADILDLKTNMVGLTRWSQAERWMNEIISSTNMEEMDIYYAQVNSLPIRFSMVKDALIDAAILPQPWADSLISLGHNSLRDTIVNGMGFFISPNALNDSIRQKQALLLKKIYLEALKQKTDTATT